MNKSVNGKVNQKQKYITSLQSLGSGWDEAIKYARQELDQARFRVSQIKVAIRVFEEQKTAGAAWPGDKATQSPSQ